MCAHITVEPRNKGNIDRTKRRNRQTHNDTKRV